MPRTETDSIFFSIEYLAHNCGAVKGSQRQAFISNEVRLYDG